MHIDAREYEKPEIEADVCVVGAGAAGISIALGLAGSGLRVLLLESGGFERDTKTDLLTAAETPTIGGGYLANSRVRVFGGTTSHWTGFCLPLDAPTFATRPWVPDSGWPLDAGALQPFYDRACAQIGIDPWVLGGDPVPHPEAPRVRLSEAAQAGERTWKTRIYQIRRRAHFGRAHRDTLVDHDDVTVMTHATCTRLRAREQHVERAVVRTLTGRRFEVKARAFVLAGGGIENARLLLWSNESHAAGLGNGRDLVGRYYMDHPEMVVAEAVLWSGWDLQLYSSSRRGDGYVGLGALFPTAEHQRAHGLLQSGMQLARAGRRFGTEKSADIDRAVTGAGQWLDCARREDDVCVPAAQRTALFVRAEQAPHRDNRVRLGTTHDAFETPLPRLEWRMNELDAVSLQRTVQALGHAFHRDGLGRIRSFVAHTDVQTLDATYGITATDAQRDRVHQERRPLVLLWGHHMGTTRMSDDPSRGVVDRHCRVHDVGNLHIAGSSVFPTGGAANPTLTIVALALRLADRLTQTLA